MKFMMDIELLLYERKDMTRKNSPFTTKKTTINDLGGYFFSK